MFSSIQQQLLKQINGNKLEGEVEIVVFEDNGENILGMKRNLLIKEAKGEFVCFVDDDDWVADNYVKILYDAIKNNPDIDCVGIKGMLVSSDLGNRKFIHSVRYDSYSQDLKYYYRPPNHLNPIRKEIAQQFSFPIKNFGEDTDWALQISKSKLLKKEVFVDAVLYYYRFSFSESATHGRR